jgi:sialic acid synthase SpsE
MSPPPARQPEQRMVCLQAMDAIQKNVCIIAEIGMNHMGDPAYADTYVDTLIQARPDGVTFQVREKAYYAKQKPGESPYLAPESYRSAATRLRQAGIQFGVALCDLEDIAFFTEIGTDFYKVLSKDIGNHPLIAAIARTGKPIYVSTGMSDEDEIASFLTASDDFLSQITLIHTQLSYDDADTNLRSITRLRERFHRPVAFGSHSTDPNVLYVTLGFNPSALFLYVKGDRPIQHKDEDHAILLSRTAALIDEIRRLETMLGDGIKKKMSNRIVAQKI